MKCMESSLFTIFGQFKRHSSQQNTPWMPSCLIVIPRKYKMAKKTRHSKQQHFSTEGNLKRFYNLVAKISELYNFKIGRGIQRETSFFILCEILTGIFWSYYESEYIFSTEPFISNLFVMKIGFQMKKLIPMVHVLHICHPSRKNRKYLNSKFLF